MFIFKKPKIMCSSWTNNFDFNKQKLYSMYDAYLNLQFIILFMFSDIETLGLSKGDSNGYLLRCVVT